MKRVFPFALLLLCVFSFSSNAQNIQTQPVEEGGEYPIGRNDANNPCITPEQYKIIEKQNIDNCKLLGIPYGMQKSIMWIFRANRPLFSAVKRPLILNRIF